MDQDHGEQLLWSMDEWREESMCTGPIRHLWDLDSYPHFQFRLSFSKQCLAVFDAPCVDSISPLAYALYFLLWVPDFSHTSDTSRSLVVKHTHTVWKCRVNDPRESLQQVGMGWELMVKYFRPQVDTSGRLFICFLEVSKEKPALIILSGDLNSIPLGGGFSFPLSPSWVLQSYILDLLQNETHAHKSFSLILLLGRTQVKIVTGEYLEIRCFQWNWAQLPTSVDEIMYPLLSFPPSFTFSVIGSLPSKPWTQVLAQALPPRGTKLR